MNNEEYIKELEQRIAIQDQQLFWLKLGLEEKYQGTDKQFLAYMEVREENDELRLALKKIIDFNKTRGYPIDETESKIEEKLSKFLKGNI